MLILLKSDLHFVFVNKLLMHRCYCQCRFGRNPLTNAICVWGPLSLLAAFCPAQSVHTLGPKYRSRTATPPHPTGNFLS